MLTDSNDDIRKTAAERIINARLHHNEALERISAKFPRKPNLLLFPLKNNVLSFL